MAITKKQIAKWNEEFKSLSKPEQRVLIAKDVIKQLKLRKYIARESIYVEYIPAGGNLDVRSNFDKVDDCHCCALGSCLLSLTKYNNKFTFNDLDNLGKPVWKELAKFFTVNQLTLIEYAFEGWYKTKEDGVGKCHFNPTVEDSELDKCHSFYSIYENDEKQRLIAIMKNIIKNKGTFKP